MLIFHIITGSLVLFFGLVALFSSKGLRLHKSAGNIFFITMVLLSLTAAYLEFQLGDFPIMGIFSLYFASTSWVTVKRQAGKTGRFEFCAFLCITLVAITFYKWGWDIIYNGVALEGTLPIEGYFILGSIAAFAAVLDLNMIIRGGHGGSHRIARHLWRMCIALLLATMAFLDQDIFPENIMNSGLLWSPIILLLLMIIYWLCRLPFMYFKVEST
ncbi:MAG: hypothetical protein ACI9LM_001578 [Alteromonadaceae bacterium]|jgi:hypothetical protein